MQRPLTNNHCAKQLKKFFREKQIPYSELHNTVSVLWPNLKSFPPLTFAFTGDRIKVWNKLPSEKQTIHHFQLTTITNFFNELINNDIVHQHHLTPANA